MKAYHIYFLRHGMTEGNEKGRYIGVTDLHLSDEGKRLLTELSEKSRYPRADMFFSSPLKRCTESIEVLFPGASAQIIPELAENNFGDYEGRTFDELKDNEGYRQWIAGAGKSAPPNGESGVEFQARSCAGFVKAVEILLHSGRQSACIMAHGGTIMSVLSTFGFPRRQFYEWMTKNGMGYEIVITPQLWVNGKIIEIAEALPYRNDDVKFDLNGFEDPDDIK